MNSNKLADKAGIKFGEPRTKDGNTNVEVLFLDSSGEWEILGRIWKVDVSLYSTYTPEPFCHKRLDMKAIFAKMKELDSCAIP